VTLETRLAAFISAIGADIKQMKLDIAAGGGGGPDIAAEPRPANHGFKAWTFDPAAIANQALILASGTLQGIRIYNPTAAAISISSVTLYVAVAGATLSNVGFCVYNAAGTLLTSSINTNGATNTAFQSNGVKTVTFAAQTIPAGSSIVIGFWFAGTTMPTLPRGNSVALLNNVGLAAPNLRVFTANTGLTNNAPATIGTQTAGANAWWLAVS
jgi:hypothetical protein